MGRINPAIPPNDPHTPRWLLDLEEWRIHPYTSIPAATLEAHGYGVVSYTWGYIVATPGQPAPNPPAGLLWDVPTVSAWPLSRAREVMQTIGTRYVWWDWMCVPQRGEGLRPLSRELEVVQAEEIGKQMHIYGNATKSIIWLHSTNWTTTPASAMQELLHLRLYYDEDTAPDPNTTPTSLQNHANHIAAQLALAHEQEHWTRSGWTLQEGVLLHETDLIDGRGARLTDLTSPGYFLGDHATVADLTIPVTRLAFELAIAYFMQSQGYEPDVGAP
ncbi:uncharacterized protein BP01DRAFT_293944, partial [Aspergillus saccharolyticus JOP 1030-1]